MAEALDVISATLGAFVEAGRRARARPSELVALQREALARAAARTALERARRRRRRGRAARARSRTLGVAEPWRLAEPLAAAGVDEAWLAARRPSSPGPATDAALRWVAASLTARSLAAELHESTDAHGRASSAAIKSYAYMDRGELVEVDLHEGLETTLVVLGHKLKHTAIEVVRDYDRDAAAS